MDNPFLKRATEYFRQDLEAFLAVVTPEPIRHFLGPHAQDDQLYDRLVIIQGTPGSGKTTIAQLFEFPTLVTLLRNPGEYRPLHAALFQCGAIRDDTVRILGCRLSLETDYRDFWEFPYPPEVKLGLMTSLLQARAILAWFNDLGDAGIGPEAIQIVPREDAFAATEMIGGTDGTSVLEKAHDVELRIYQIVAALIAPSLAELDPSLGEAYRPFDVIQSIRILDEGTSTAQFLPLVILDDAHLLHPEQFRKLKHWLVRRELRVGRWMMTRLDVLTPEEAIQSITEDREEHVALPGVTSQRDILPVMLQSGPDRTRERVAFRKMASDMSDRYLQAMPLFYSRRHDNLGRLLSRNTPTLSAAKRRELEVQITVVQRQLNISDARRAEMSAIVNKYRPDDVNVTAEIRLAIINILMHRYVKRTGQTTLFEEVSDPEPSRPLKVDASVCEAARLHLLHKHGLPFYYGLEDLCDASSENAELFLRLASQLVESLMVHIIRAKPVTLDAATQHRLLTQQAVDFIQHWNYPQHRQVFRLVSAIAERCLEATLSSNAWLAPGANAYGIPQREFETLVQSHEDVARVLQFAVAYNAIHLVPNYNCKQKQWCLLELGGVVILSRGLTLKRGGFIEGTLAELKNYLDETRVEAG